MNGREYKNINQEKIVKVMILSMIALIFMGLISKEGISLDYVIHNNQCQKISIVNQKISTMNTVTTNIVCEENQRFFRCVHYDHKFNQLTEVKKFYKQYEHNHEIKIVAKDQSEVITFNSRSRQTASSQNLKDKDVGHIICTGELQGREKLRERFPDLIAEKR